jgi:hypothetical protein
MPSRIRRGLLIIFAIAGLFFSSDIASHSQTVNYIYDDL